MQSITSITTTRRILTDATDPDRLSKALKRASKLLETADELGLSLHSEVELVLYLVISETQQECRYYFVDHKERALFWVHEFDLRHIYENARGVTPGSHRKQAITTQYWIHVELYPNFRRLQRTDYEELRNILIHARADKITSPNSLVSFEADDIGTFLDLVDKLQGSINEENAYALCVVARLMRSFSHNRFVNFHGQPSARLNANQSIYAHTRDRSYDLPLSLLYQLCNIVLLGSPAAHAKELKQVWVDHVINYPHWKTFSNKMSKEWTGFTVFSTVMLAVNLSSLGLPIFNGGGNSTGTILPSTTQPLGAIISIYLSMIFVLGSMLTSIQLSSRLEGENVSSAEEVADLMLRVEHSIFGIGGLAILYSLPYALLAWGMFCFGLAISFIIYGSANILLLKIAGPIMFLVALLITWCSLGSQGYFTVLHSWFQRLVARRKVFLERRKTARSFV